MLIVLSMTLKGSFFFFMRFINIYYCFDIVIWRRKWTMTDKLPTIITIEVATTWLRLLTKRNGDIGGINISRYIYRNLQEHEYIPRLRRWEIKARYTLFDDKTSMAYMPRYALDELIAAIKEEAAANKIECQICTVDVEPVAPKHVEMAMVDTFALRGHQPEMIEFLEDQSCGFKPLALMTGSGKTVCTIKAIVDMGYPALIVLGLLIDQWYKSILQFTKCSKDDIFVVKGYDSLATLWKAIDGGYQPKFVLFSTRTLALYCISPQAPYSTLPSYQKFQKAVGFGVKVIDECHLNFNTNSLIDYNTNIKMNIYLSATYQRSDSQGKRIFNTYFPPALKYGEQFTKKYTTVYMLKYHLCIPPRDENKFKVPKGYLHALYENYILKHKNTMLMFTAEVVRPAIQQYFIMERKPGQHLLILTNTKQFAIRLTEDLRKLLPQLTMSIFFSGSPDAYGKESNLESDVIVSTVKSCGTGRDIKGLKTCINTTSFSSEPLCIQMLGRLREIPGEETIYIDMYNTELQSHRNHAWNRHNVYQLRAKQYKTRTIR